MSGGTGDGGGGRGSSSDAATVSQLRPKHSFDPQQVVPCGGSPSDELRGPIVADAAAITHLGRNYEFGLQPQSFPDETPGDSLSAAPMIVGNGGEAAVESPESESGVLKEFVGAGGGSGIFGVPSRSVVSPDRPPSLELRPRPPRETQAGSFLRVLACAPRTGRGQLWVGTECGLRVWGLDSVFSEWGNGVGNVAEPRKGDEESAPFLESVDTPPTLCLVVDVASRIVWSGHTDGKIRSWKMDSIDCQAGGGERWQIEEGLSWQAHIRAPVLSMVITPHGEIWSGSEGGAIRAWPWEAIQKSLSMSIEERDEAASLVERSYVDLKGQVTIGGICPLPIADVKYMLADNCNSKVWSLTSISFALWDSRTRDLLKIFGMDGQVDSVQLDAPFLQESYIDDEKVKFISSLKEKKSQDSSTFFQRSRNALMGAADAIRRVAIRSSFDDNPRTGAVAIATDGKVWSGCTDGTLVIWEGNGNRVQELHFHESSILCICTFGERVWVGYASGMVQVLDLECNLLGGWVAHSCPVIDMAIGGMFIFTLSHYGEIRGWHLTSPSSLDYVLRDELARRALSYSKLENIRMLVGTWNVGQEKASDESLVSWLGTKAPDVDLVVVGLQEVEMGAAFLAMSAAKESVGLDGSAIGQWWLEKIGMTLEEGISFQRVGTRQLAGLLICSWVRKNIAHCIGDVDTAAVPCGFGRAIGNKGGVGLRMRLFGRTICFVNSHLAAHLEAVSRRNADFDHIYRTMEFSKLHGMPACATAMQLCRAANANGSQTDNITPELSEADMVVFLGDFNYRLHSITYDEARDMVQQRSFDWLQEKDQLRAEMRAGKVFQGMREGQIKFPPTYKFQIGQPGLSGYDSSEKKRIPAWCDRVLYRDSRVELATECSLECPIVASIASYEACMDVTDSDHKPVRCVFHVQITRVDEATRRKEYQNIIESNETVRSFIGGSLDIPETLVSTNNIILQNRESGVLRITNKSSRTGGWFEISCESQSTITKEGLTVDACSRGSYGFPLWLEVHPSIGIIKQGQTIEVTVCHEHFFTQEEFINGVQQNWWCEDTRDKEVLLLVTVGSLWSSTGSTRTHRVIVRNCCLPSLGAATSLDADTPGNLSEKNQSNHLHRSDFGRLTSADVPDLHNLRLS